MTLDTEMLYRYLNVKRQSPAIQSSWMLDVDPEESRKRVTFATNEDGVVNRRQIGVSTAV